MNNPKFANLRLKTVLLLGLMLAGVSAFANIPGGGTGTGPAVTLLDNGDGTVTMANGTVSIHIVKSGASIDQVNYTWNNGGGTQTQQLLAGGKNGGQFYWEFGGFGSGSGNYSVVANNGNYAEVALFFDSATNGTVDVHFSMLRGSTGFYVTPIWSHRVQDGPQGTGEERDNIYFAPYFNWMSVNDQVQREEGLNNTYAPAFYSPQENSLVTSGGLEGTYEDKYKWSADFGEERVWGWSSVSDAAAGVTGKNIGIWHVVASPEFYNGGPLKPELNDAPMVNMINGGHYYFGNDSDFGNAEVWTRMSGPYFIYFNNVANTLTDPVQTSQALWADAKAQATAEGTAWPYSWMTNANYAPAAQRGRVAGQIIINDAFNPGASASNLWVGVVQQPITINGKYDFQLWMKPYQFWTKSDASGNFVISNVIAGANYTLYAFGPGAEGMFMSQNQTGGTPGIIYNLPDTPFAVAVTGGTTNSLGPVTWTPTRLGPTVFELGYPDRKGDKFRHGEDYWVGDVGPSPTAPSPIWTKFMEFPYDYPNGLNYVVGQNRWNTDWNFIQSVYPDPSGNSIGSSSTVTFNLASDPTSATASLLMGIASDDNTPIYVTVNGTLLSGGNASGTPQTSLPTTGWFPINDISDTNIREENHGGYSDERLTFAGSLLHTGNNTINFSFRQAGGSGFTHHFIYDYIRLELTGYVPPAPTGVTAYAGNNCNLICWPAVAGATSYNILRSTTSGNGYVSITNGVVGPVCGSGPQNAAYVDATAANGTTYYYVVQSVNPVNASGNSPQSSGVAPSSGISGSAPTTPTGLTVTSTNNAVTLAWNAVPGANFYTIQRGTVLNNLGYVAFYITLDNATTGTTFTDASGTLGCNYSYIVTATSAGGTSGNSAAVTAKPVPPPPASAPANMSITTTITPTNQSAHITWSPVSGAVGYILYRANSTNGPFSFPGNYVQSMTTTTYTDGGLNSNTLYSYTVIAMNAGGVSGNSAVVSTPPAAPGLNAYPANAQISLVWSASAGAINYTLKRGTGSGAETTLVTTTNTSYLDTGLANGTPYYYIVIANGSGGPSINSLEVSATPFIGPPAVYWINSITAAAQGWNVNTNWSNGTAFPNASQATAIVNAPIAANQTVNLNQATTVGAMSIGAGGGAFNISANGGTLTFDNTPGTASLVQLVASKGDTISAPVILNTSLAVSNLSANALTLSGGISGSNLIINSGNTILSGTDTYTGGTTVNGGRLTFNAGTAIPSSGTLMLNSTGAVTVVSASGLPNVLVNGNNTITGNGNSGTGIATLDDEGTVTLFVSGGSKVFDLTGTITGPGTLILGSAPMGLRFNGTSGDGSAIFNLGTGVNGASIRNGPFTLALGGLAGGPGTTLSGASSANTAATFTIGGANADAEFDGVIADGGNSAHPAVSIIKTGGNTQVFTNVNTYSGGTTINGGTLLVNNSGGSGTGSDTVTVAGGGTLGGTGIISGAVAVNSSGALAPGNPLGTLTISNNLTLAPGSTTFVRVQHSPLTNNAAKVSGTLTEGGTLNVTNIGAATLANGDSFKLFSAAGYSGSFAGFVLPSLGPNLAWRTTTLSTNGVISIVSLTPPVIGGAGIVNGKLILNGSGAPANWSYLVLSSTDISLPLAQWTPIATNQTDAGGNFAATNSVGPNLPQTFLILQFR